MKIIINSFSTNLYFKEGLILIMEKSQMKNIVVLRNLPSNLIEEAFVIVKSKKTSKALEYIDNREKNNKKRQVDNVNDYIIREAESVISSYLKVIEKKNDIQNKFRIDSKYKILKWYSIIITVILGTCLIIF